VTLATGTAEREAALAMMEEREGQKRVTLGGDKNFDVHDFVEKLRGQKVTPHVAQNVSARLETYFFEQKPVPRNESASSPKAVCSPIHWRHTLCHHRRRRLVDCSMHRVTDQGSHAPRIAVSYAIFSAAEMRLTRALKRFPRVP